MNQEFKTLQEQINILKSRNMIMSSNDEKYLLHFNYGYIVYNYSIFFLSNNGKTYKDGTKLKDLIDFWKFERELMSWIMPNIYKFEHIFKSTIAYVLAKINPFAHYGDEIYDERKTIKVLRLKKDFISKELIYIMKNNSEYLTNNKVPIWILINELTFNDLIKLFECLTSKFRKEFLEKIEYNGKEKDFTKHCRTIKEYRNRESHNGIIHKTFKLMKSENERFLNDCILGLSKIKENIFIKNELAYKFYESNKNNDHNNKIQWLENVYKIKISNELRKIKKSEAEN